MKAFSVVCATLSVIQVFIIDESTALKGDKKGYVKIAGQEMTGDSVGNRRSNSGIPHGVTLGDNKNNMVNGILYDGYGNDAVPHVNTGNDIPMRSWNNMDKNEDNNDYSYQTHDINKIDGDTVYDHKGRKMSMDSYMRSNSNNRNRKDNGKMTNGLILNSNNNNVVNDKMFNPFGNGADGAVQVGAKNSMIPNNLANLGNKITSDVMQSLFGNYEVNSFNTANPKGRMNNRKGNANREMPKFPIIGDNKYNLINGVMYDGSGNDSDDAKISRQLSRTNSGRTSNLSMFNNNNKYQDYFPNGRRRADENKMYPVQQKYQQQRRNSSPVYGLD